MSGIVRNERGSAVLFAVLAMLLLSVLTLSFVLVADLESQASVSFRQHAQAEALAEAGLELARDAVRPAPDAGGRFTGWFDGSRAAHVLFSQVALNGGWYSARIDNDCAAVIPGLPAAIQEPNGPPGDRPCDNAADHNGVAVLTAWATAGGGRARVRAVVSVDSPWQHVCAGISSAHDGACREPAPPGGGPSLSPADPSDRNGPAAYDLLPRPILGCSRIAPGLHRGPHALATQRDGCFAHPRMYAAPYPTAPAGPPRFVVMGADAAAGGRTCYEDPVTPGLRYFGYFDCALQTQCDAATMPCGSWGDRKGCVAAADSRLASHPTRYVAYDPATGRCGSGGPAETGLVCLPGQPCSHFSQDVGSPGVQLTMYIFRQGWSQASHRKTYGTVVVEGPPGGGLAFAAGGGAAAALWAGPNQFPPPAGWTWSRQYGYPLAALIYNPEVPPPAGAPQNHLADFGGAGARVHGIVYAAGHARFDAGAVQGGVVAGVLTGPSGGTVTYDAGYGEHTPPPGFPPTDGHRVVLVRKSVMACANYRDDSASPTACP